MRGLTLAAMTRHRLPLSLLLVAAVVSPTTPALADGPADPYTLRPSVMAGLLQWIAFGGGNLAGQVKVGRAVLEYSHGQALDFSRSGGFALSQRERDEGAKAGMRWTTGGGAGLQITPRLHVLIEVKAHRVELTARDRNQVAAYTAYTVGPGIFYDLYVAGGFFVQPNVRYWPTVASTYKRADATFVRADGTSYTLPRHDNPLFVNVNVGCTFAGL